ncbi:bifunctional metallophosphatase/5'-nucleotidase [Frigidibacter sp. MR17.24]|uniref:bifunctional metallophosphatase/5'-nucleotidase n=1 Tax=Frigidibacter sp. MR17.24 TaxID=3127345 RepID=UPI0030130675
MQTRLLASAAALALSAGTAHADYTLHVLHINDLHSRIQSINKYDSTCDAEGETKGECFGGIARVKTEIDKLRGELTGAGQNVIVLDAGDQYQGSLFYSTYKGELVAELMTDIGFDAMALGNHEFDDGPEGTLQLLDNVSFPVISGNLDLTSSAQLKDKVKDHVVLEVGGEKIGIISALAVDTPETSSPGPDVVFQNEADSLAADAAALEAEGVTKIIALTHVGYTKDQAIAAAAEGIDAIIGGHSHTLLSNTDEKAAGPFPTMVAGPSGTEVPISTAYAYSKYLGHTILTFDDAGKLIKAEGEPILLDASVEPDPAMTARIAELAGPIDALKAKVVAATEADIDGARESCRAVECSMGNLIADAQLARVKDQGITISFANGGGMRASIGAGDVTMGDVLTVLPFQNTLSTFQAKGSTIVAALENGVSQYEDAAGRFAQVAGLHYAFDISKPVGERVSDVMVEKDGQWVPIDPEATYGVVTNNYVRNGGDGYKVFAAEGMNAYDFGPDLADVTAEYLAANQPYTPYTDGRIVKK